MRLKRRACCTSRARLRRIELSSASRPSRPDFYGGGCRATDICRRPQRTEAARSPAGGSAPPREDRHSSPPLNRRCCAAALDLVSSRLGFVLQPHEALLHLAAANERGCSNGARVRVPTARSGRTRACALAHGCTRSTSDCKAIGARELLAEVRVALGRSRMESFLSRAKYVWSTAGGPLVVRLRVDDRSERIGGAAAAG